jgi:hypothetical protein
MSAPVPGRIDLGLDEMGNSPFRENRSFHLFPDAFHSRYSSAALAVSTVLYAQIHHFHTTTQRFCEYFAECSYSLQLESWAAYGGEAHSAGMPLFLGGEHSHSGLWEHRVSNC